MRVCHQTLINFSFRVQFSDSPRGSIDINDDTEQLMDDLFISFPMIGVKSHGMRPRQRLEPLLEEDDSESSSVPCSPSKSLQAQGTNEQVGRS